MCSQVSCVKVTCAPPCAALAPEMQARTCVPPSSKPPIRTPQTSFLRFERACWRIWRATSVLMRTLACLSLPDLDITRRLGPAGRERRAGPPPGKKRFSRGGGAPGKKKKGGGPGCATLGRHNHCRLPYHAVGAPP